MVLLAVLAVVDFVFVFVVCGPETQLCRRIATPVNTLQLLMVLKKTD